MIALIFNDCFQKEESIGSLVVAGVIGTISFCLVGSDAPSSTQRCLTGDASLPSQSEEQLSFKDGSIVALRPRCWSSGLAGLYSLKCVLDIMYSGRQSLGPVRTLSPSSSTLVVGAEYGLDTNQ
jgi:hypothetical protein